MQNKIVLFFAVQAGVAKPFVNWIQQLSQEPTQVKWKVLCSESCKSEFANAGISFSIAESEAELRNYLANSVQLSLIVSDTSFESTFIDDIWRWGIDENIPILAFVDQWSNIKRRFKSRPSPVSIAVVDEVAKNLVLQEVSSTSEILVVGHPQLSKLERIHSRKEFKKVLLLTEPFINFQDQQEFLTENGYSETEYLKTALTGISDFPGVSLKVKLHPRDNRGRIIKLLAKWTKIQWDFAEAKDSLHDFDLVVGMRSILLLESALRGIPTLSVQPGRLRENPLTDYRAGLIVCTSPQSIKNDIESALGNNSTEPDKTISIPPDSMLKAIRSKLRLA